MLIDEHGNIELRVHTRSFASSPACFIFGDCDPRESFARAARFSSATHVASGLDIGSTTDEETAGSVLVEIVAVRSAPRPPAAEHSWPQPRKGDRMRLPVSGAVAIDVLPSGVTRFGSRAPTAADNTEDDR
jgi:hypothetical protein